MILIWQFGNHVKIAKLTSVFTWLNATATIIHIVKLDAATI